MYRMGPTGMKWLKGLHLFTVSCWVGGGVALVLLFFLKSGVDDGGVLYGVNQGIHFVDMMVVVIPGAFGCLLTGLAFSLLTGWGFFKHGWIIFKWILTIAAILFGTFFLGPWETRMMELSGELGIKALGNADYLHNEIMNFAFGIVQVLALIATLFISLFKPWKNIGRKSGRA